MRFDAARVATPTVPMTVTAAARTSPMTGEAIVPPPATPTRSFPPAPPAAGESIDAAVRSAALVPEYFEVLPATPTASVAVAVFASQNILPPWTRAPGGS